MRSHTIQAEGAGHQPPVGPGMGALPTLLYHASLPTVQVQGATPKFQKLMRKENQRQEDPSKFPSQAEGFLQH